MTQGYAKAPAAQRWFALLLIAALHAVGVLCWPERKMDNPNLAPRREMGLTFVTIPAPVQLPATPVAVARRQARKIAPPPQSLRFIPPPPPDAVLAEDAPAPPVRSAADITLQAKRDIGKIDRDLRSASLDMADRHLVLTQPKRERGIGAAFIDRGPPRVVEEVLNDGSRRSRIGTSCVQKESNGLVGARDVFRDGVKTRWGGC